MSAMNKSINYYDEELIVDIHDDINSSVLYNIINATIYENKIGNTSSPFLYIQSSYLNAKDLSINSKADIHCNLSKNSNDSHGGFYFSVPDEKANINHHYEIKNFEELYIALEDGANIRMRINLTASNINMTGNAVANNDIFGMFHKGIHSEKIGSNWEAIKGAVVSWTTEQFISSPIDIGLQFYILSTTVVNIRDEINVHSAVLDKSMNIIGWINVTDTKLKDTVVFYSDLEIHV